MRSVLCNIDPNNLNIQFTEDSKYKLILCYELLHVEFFLKYIFSFWIHVASQITDLNIRAQLRIIFVLELPSQNDMLMWYIR